MKLGKIKYKIVSTVLAVLVFSGCVGIPDGEGWRSGQKSDFLEILETDKYVSICNEQALYAKVKSSQSSTLMTKLLVAYTKNLANGCIVDPVLTSEVHGKEVTDYGVYRQKVSASDIKMKLKAGESIEKILQPYVPSYVQFSKLVAQYNALAAKGSANTDLARKVHLNIERLKLMKSDIGTNYAIVNIPEFKVHLIEKDKTAISMAVVVGKKSLKTPIFSSDLSYITLNPQWSVPDSIARHEVIPALLKDPKYLTKKRMVMRKDYNLKSPVLTPSSVDLAAYKGGKGPVPFKFIEVPSEKNGLGRVKFIFPNRYNVYMHDTQSKYLFKRKVRTYSHGCVRLSQPYLMLDHVSKNYTTVTAEEVKEDHDSLETHYIKIEKRLAVHTAYFTTYVDDAGKMSVFPDIYGYDKAQTLNF